jgi:thiaminase/transcriptional activator TenA
MTKKFTEQLREAAGEQWERVINHRFTTELASGNIDRNVLKKYLVQDHRFLDAFVILLSSAIAKARSLDDRIPGCQFLGLITGKENTYFERSFEVLPCCSKEERAKIPDEAVTVNFVNLMKEVSYGGTLG